MNINKTIQSVLEQYRKGDLQSAERLCQKIIRQQPNHAEILYFLGIIYGQLGKHDLAIEYIRKSLQINKNNADAYLALSMALQIKGLTDEAASNGEEAIRLDPNNAVAFGSLGNIFRAKGDPDKAMEYYQRALQIAPNFDEGYSGMGLILQEKGRTDEAVGFYLKAHQLNPDNLVALYGLGTALKEIGQLDEAVRYYQKSLTIFPDSDMAYHNLGTILQEKGRIDEAIDNYRKALEINPGNGEVYIGLGNALKDKGLLDDAVNHYRKALEINPESYDAHYNIGVVMYGEGNHEEAIDAFKTAITIRPDDIMAVWAKCIAQIPIIYPCQSDIEISRRRYYHELLRLCETVSIEGGQKLASAAKAVGSMQPFYLAAQGLNDRELQKLYGTLVCRVMAKKYPQFAEPPVIPYVPSTGPLRIGMVSKYFYHHSVWKIPIKGWVENIDKTRFHLYGYHLGNVKDAATLSAAKLCTRFTEGKSSFKELCRTIRNDNLNVLIYPEIGMDPMTLRLASLRLAPIQCTSLGHPDTSGLPTIDYYLSSNLMEPAAAEDHYTEKLIRLPNLGFFYTPLDVPAGEMNREMFGLRPDPVIYLCSHSLFTHLPQYDEIYPRIAQPVGNCVFLFISSPKSNTITEKVRSRIGDAFRRYDLSPDEYVIFLPFLDQRQYYAVNSISDVFLDTMGWSANNSTFEAIACNLPIVTLPGGLMRQRHCAGILTMLGLTETIASSIDEYIAYAVRLAKDPKWRSQISGKIASKKHLIYKDRSAVTALEDFIEQAVREGLQGTHHV
jgi:protein O-GlcNAc transferase